MVLTDAWSATDLTSDISKAVVRVTDSQQHSYDVEEALLNPVHHRQTVIIQTMMLMQVHGNPSLPRLRRPNIRRIRLLRNTTPVPV